MLVYVIGDIHGRFNEADELYEVMVDSEGREPDLLIQVGDFGFWPREDTIEPWTREFNHPCLWIDGNHEDFKALGNLDKDGFGVVDPYHNPNYLGWKKCLDQWEYMPRGSYRDGILFLGGAKSIDKHQRTKGEDWFPEENITWMDQQKAAQTIEEVGSENIHTVITHDAPAGFNIPGSHHHGEDGNRRALQVLMGEVEPDRWFFGHHHQQASGTYNGCEWRCIDMVHKFNQEKNGDWAVFEI